MSTVPPRSRPMVGSGSIVNDHTASSISAWWIVTGSMPPLTTWSRTMLGPGSSTLWIVNSSIGGALRSRPTPRASRKPSRPTRTATTMAPATIPARLPRGDIEEPHPSELGEFALVRVEHELPRMPELELQDVALALAEHDGVGELVGLEPGAGAVQVEEVAVDVKRVDEVEFERVDDVEPHLLAHNRGERVAHVVEGHRVHRVELVLGVEIGIEAVHHHHVLARRGPATGRIHDEGAVEPLVDVPLERSRVAVIQVKPERLGVELIDERLARIDDLEHPVHVGGMEAVEVDRVGVAARVLEADTEAIALRAADRGPRHRAVVGPGREPDARGDFDLAVHCNEVVLPQSATTG